MRVGLCLACSRYVPIFIWIFVGSVQKVDLFYVLDVNGSVGNFILVCHIARLQLCGHIV